MANHYREVIAWQKAMSLAEAVYAVAASLPPVERFGMCSQLRRSAVSVPSNIAEGYERRSRADYRRFITIACGSVAEIETQIELVRRLYRLDAEAMKAADDLCEETGKLLRAIERGLRENRTAEDPAVYGAADDQPSSLGPRPSALSPQP